MYNIIENISLQSFKSQNKDENPFLSWVFFSLPPRYFLWRVSSLSLILLHVPLQCIGVKLELNCHLHRKEYWPFKIPVAG